MSIHEIFHFLCFLSGIFYRNTVYKIRQTWKFKYKIFRKNKCEVQWLSLWGVACRASPWGAARRASPWGAAAEPHLGELPAEPVLELWLLHRRALLSSSGVTSCFSVTQLCLTLCDPMDCSMPDFPVLHYLLELAQTHVHQVGDAIQPSCPLSSPSAFNLSQHQILF